ncbi:MAG: hypothetical protein SNJ77_01845 [Cytophagales bacterium]
MKIQLIIIALVLSSWSLNAQDFSKTISGKTYFVKHNPDAISPDEEFEASTHQFLSGGKYVITHPKGIFQGEWKFDETKNKLEISVVIAGKMKKYSGGVQSATNSKFIFDMVTGSDGESESLLFQEK